MGIGMSSPCAPFRLLSGCGANFGESDYRRNLKAPKRSEQDWNG